MMYHMTCLQEDKRQTQYMYSAQNLTLAYIKHLS